MNSCGVCRRDLGRGRLFCSRQCNGVNRRKNKVAPCNRFKTCLTCDMVFLKPNNRPFSSWVKAKYCSNRCKGGNNRLQPGQWSLKYEFCIICKRKDRKYLCSGLCGTCYKRSKARERGARPWSLVQEIAIKKRLIHLLDKLRRTRENKLRKQLRERAKKHLRRVRIQSVKTDIDTQFLFELWNKTDICEICNLIMDNNHAYPNGRHLDHIVPLSLGGPHLRENVRYIHAYCNVRRKRNNLNFKKLGKNFIQVQP